ncbi:MFS transporter [Brevibacillus thermoruber]|uniref:MFS transporter n=1 Tax=Brevibacillus thermoruber TaxID=33942 RepID=UPI00048F25B7
MFRAVSFLFWVSHFLYVPILSPCLESLGGTYAWIGLVLSSYGLAQCACRVPFGIFSDLVKVRMPFIRVGLAIGTCSCLLFALTDSLGWVLVSRSLAGVAAATWVAFTVLYSRHYPDRDVHRAMSSISFVVVLAQLTGMSAGGYLVNQWGWHAPFWLGTMTAYSAAVGDGDRTHSP